MKLDETLSLALIDWILRKEQVRRWSVTLPVLRETHHSRPAVKD